VVVRTLGLLIVRRVMGLVGFGPAPDAKDVEIAVLRHQPRSFTPVHRFVVVCESAGDRRCW
jgi:hypothetical protein